ncbi:MAG: hypothetical protein ACXVQT_01000 [Actinomycetota bacterium]
MPDPRTDALASALRAVAPRVTYPPTPSIAPMVGARLHADAARTYRPPFARIAAWPRRRVVVAIALAFLLLATAAAAGRLAIGAVSIEIVPSPAPSAAPEAPAAFGRDLTMQQAVERIAFEPGWPPSLGWPDDAYVVAAGTGPEGRVLVLAWRTAEGLPPIPGTPWRAVLYEVPGPVEIATKYVAASSIHPARVHGTRAYWISGAHDLAFAGAFGGEPVRVSGNVLLWQRSPDVTYRLETMLPKAAAVALAETLR